MKYKLNKYVLGMLVIVFLLTACDKTEDQLASIGSQKSEEGYIVKDGYLAFKNNESFIKTVSEIVNLSNADRNKWESSIEFISQRSLINNLIVKELALDSINRIKFAHTDISQATKFDLRPELYYSLLSNGVIKIIGEGTTDEYWDYSAFNKGFTAFINEDGLYAVGDSLFQVTNKGLKVVKLSSASNKQELLKALNNEKSVSKINKITEGISADSPGLIESVGNNGPWTQNNSWPSASKRIKLGIELSWLIFSYVDCGFTFTHNYYVTCQKTNFWNNWINDYANYTLEGNWDIIVYYVPQSYSYYNYSYTGTAISGVVNPETGERVSAGTTFSVDLDGNNLTFPYPDIQIQYPPDFRYYKWKATRTDTGQQSYVKSYSGSY